MFNLYWNILYLNDEESSVMEVKYPLDFNQQYSQDRSQSNFTESLYSIKYLGESIILRGEIVCIEYLNKGNVKDVVLWDLKKNKYCSLIFKIFSSGRT